MATKVLFICKMREGYGSDYSSQSFSSGLLNSANFVADMLNAANIQAKVVQVIDNNDIDREVAAYQPTHCIIEALWVVPEKFPVLSDLHPHVKWIVRLHSQIPFLANEGIAIDWITRCATQKNVFIAANSKGCVADVRSILGSMGLDKTKNVIYMPNFYPDRGTFPTGMTKNPNGWLDVGCFGAIRPFKNQLTQAVAAIEYAEIMGRELRFHVNSNRLEQGGETILKNLRALLSNSGHQLVEHEWTSHDDFLKILRSMDMGMAVSFTETFCIVAADMVAVGLPMVVSPEVVWAWDRVKANPAETKDIVDKMMFANGGWSDRVIAMNHNGLRNYCSHSRLAWFQYFASQR